MTPKFHLIAHLEKFLLGQDRSVQWAKDAESILDGFPDLDESLDEFEGALSLYRPEGGPHLVAEKEMETIVKCVLRHLNQE